MAEAAKQQFSLREVVGTVAPGAMVLLWCSTSPHEYPGVGRIGDVDSGWGALLILFVISYRNWDAAHLVDRGSVRSHHHVGTDEEHLDGFGDPVQQHHVRADLPGRRSVRQSDPVAYLSGGDDITTGIREFRESWQTRAVLQNVVSAHSLSLAARHCRCCSMRNRKVRSRSSCAGSSFASVCR